MSYLLVSATAAPEHVMGYEPTLDVAVAVVVQVGCVVNVSGDCRPLTVKVSVGFGAPKARFCGLALTTTWYLSTMTVLHSCTVPAVGSLPVAVTHSWCVPGASGGVVIV